jgi:phage tail sheath gpL-like
MGVSHSAIARVTGVDVSFKNFNAGRAQMLPQRVVVIGTGNDDAVYPLDKYEVGGTAAEVGDRYGYGSPLHLALNQFYPSIGPVAEFPVTIIPLQKATGAVKAAGTIEADGTVVENGSGVVYIGGISAEFSALKDDTAAVVLEKIKDAINAVLNMPATAGSVSDGELPLTAKWSGAIGNRITLEIDAIIPGVTFTLSAFSGGALDPDVSAALEKVGQIWETFFLPCFDYAGNNGRLDIFEQFAKGRAGVLEKMPCYVGWGVSDNLATRTAVSDLRVNDFINFFVPNIGSRELPFVIAAKGFINDIVTNANKNPPQNYKGLLTGLHCGSDEAQENYTQRNAAVNKGSSANKKSGNVAELTDIVTFYHPAADGKYPSKRYVVDLVKLMQVTYNVRLIMESDELKGAPLVSDATVTTNSTAVAPKTIRAMFMNLADSLALAAVIQQAEFTKKNMSVDIDSENPKRVNIKFPVKLSGNVEVSSTDVYFGFYLGGGGN